MTDNEWAQLAPEAEAYARAKLAHDDLAKRNDATMGEAMERTRLMIELQEAADALGRARHWQRASQVAATNGALMGGVAGHG